MIKSSFLGFCAVFFCLLASPCLRAADVQGIVTPFKQVMVASPVRDIVQEVNVEEGAVVKKGDLLARLRWEQERLTVEMQSKQQELDDFRSQGYDKLLREKMISKDTALESQTELGISKLQHDIAVEMLKQKSITAPLDGIVVKKFKEPGESVDMTEKMFEIVNIDKLYAQFYLEPRLLNNMKVGDIVTLSFPDVAGAHRDAHIAFIEPRIDPASGYFRVKVIFENPDHVIKAGMKTGADFDKLTASN